MDPSNRRLIILLVLVVLVAIGLLVMKRGQREPAVAATEAQPTPEVRQQQDSPQVEVAPPKQQPSTKVPEVRQPSAPRPEPTQEPPPEPTPQEDTHTRIHVNVSELRTMLNDYQTRTGAFPTTLGALGAAVPKDPWQRDYIYQSPSTRGRESYDLFSAGVDGRPDTPDDDWGEGGTEENPQN